MKTPDSLELLLTARSKQAVIAAPAGQPQMMPPPGMPPQGMPPQGMPPQGMPMDPAMMGGGMPMDPSMMGGMPPQGMPMDPAMMGMAPPPPMDPAMMGGGMPPPAPPPPPEEGSGKPKKVNVEQEISEIKEMLQALMEAQIAMMQSMGAGGMPPPPMDPAMMGGMPPQGMPMDPAMMGMPGANGGMPMDPAMMGGMPPPGMQVMASAKSANDSDMANYLKSIADLLR